MNTARLREEQEQLIRASRELLSRDVLSELSAKSGKSIKDKRQFDAIQSSGQTESETFPDRPAERRKAEPLVVDDGISVGKEDGDRLSIMSEDSQDDISADVTETCPKFVDLSSLSAGTRRAAAPHIYNIFEQIFMEDSCASIPELPDGVKRSSVLAVKNKMNGSSRASAESAYVVRVELVQHFNEIVSAGTGQGRFQFERQVLADLAIALNVSKKRFVVERIEPKEGWEKHSIFDLLIVPDEDPTAAPSCGQLAAMIVEEVNKGSLRSMPSMRKSLRAELRNENDEMRQTSTGSKECDGDLKFSLLRGGIFVDSKHISVMSAVHRGEDASSGCHGALEAEKGMEPEGLRLALALQEKEMSAARQQREERRAREGFWVDVEAGKPPPAEADNFPGQYGTFSGRSSQSSGNGTYLFWVMAVGGGIMLLLIVHVLYLHFHRVESAGDAR